MGKRDSSDAFPFELDHPKQRVGQTGEHIKMSGEPGQDLVGDRVR